MSLRSSFAAKDCDDASPRGGRNEELEELYHNGLLAGYVDPKRPPIPRWRVGLVAESNWTPGFSRSQIPPEGGTPTGTG